METADLGPTAVKNPAMRHRICDGHRRRFRRFASPTSTCEHRHDKCYDHHHAGPSIWVSAPGSDRNPIRLPSSMVPTSLRSACRQPFGSRGRRD